MSKLTSIFLAGCALLALTFGRSMIGAEASQSLYLGSASEGVTERSEQALLSASEAVQRAVAWLHTQQLPDGSFGNAAITADVVYVLALAGENPAGQAWTMGGQSALDALAKLAPSYVRADAGFAGKVLRAVALAGGNPRAFGGLNLVAIIQAAYAPSTGRYDPNLLYRDTLAMEGLLRAGEPVPNAAVQALLEAQLPDGGWFWSFDNTTPADPDSTGRVLQMLAGEMGIEAPDAFARAARYLFGMQVAGGWWINRDPVTKIPVPNANSTALALAGLSAAGYEPQSFCFQRGGRGALDALLSYQDPSGAFVYIHGSQRNLMATVDAMNALLQPPAQVPASPICEATYLPMVVEN